MRRSLVAFAIMGSVALSAVADDQNYNTWVNREIETIRVQDLHSTVRTGLFCEYAKPDVDQLQAKERLLVLGTETATCGFFRKQQYVRVKRLKSGIPSDKSNGIIRVGAEQSKVRLITE